MADENTNGGQPVNDKTVAKDPKTPVVASKKLKTERQIERERERRRRRRRKNSEKVVMGKDVPLVLTPNSPVVEGVVDQPVLPAEDLSVSSIVFSPEPPQNFELTKDEELILGSSDFPEPGPVVAEEVSGDDVQSEVKPDIEAVPVEVDPNNVVTGSDVVTEEISLSAVEPLIETVPAGEPVEEEGAVETLPSDTIPDEVVEETPAEVVPNEEKQFVIEEPVDSTVDEPVIEVVPEPIVDVVPESVVQAENSDEIVHENVNAEEDLKKAKEISQNLLNEDVLPDELPVKQGLMGRIFDWVAKKSAERKAGKNTAKSTVVESVVTEKPKSTIDFSKVFEVIKKFAGVLIILVIMIAAFWIGSSLKVYDRIIGVFNSGPSQSGEILVKGDNSLVLIDESLIRQLGFRTAKTFGYNLGNKNDLVYNVFFNAAYFGKLKEPVFYGETGVSAALYFGFGKDIVSIKNKFIYYVSFLTKLENANTVVISDVLKGKLRRDEALDQYISQNKTLFEEGNTLRKEINIQVDDFQISINSLNPDKDRNEADFFASIKAYDGNTADLTIAKFIESSQKMVELRAKLSAMTKLSGLYESKLILLKLRIEALEKNREALINDVQVTETPGFNLNLVKKEN